MELFLRPYSTVLCTHDGRGHFNRGGFHDNFPVEMKLAAIAFFELHASDDQQL